MVNPVVAYTAGPSVPRTKSSTQSVPIPESVGGSLESFDYAFGDTDAYAICEFPDAATATSFSLMVNASGAVTLTLTPLMTPEELDAGAAKAPSYRPPGG